ncbi:MAG: LysM peptidoglycan-binding domain-containing protein [Saprospiraceae bacterium]|nr:LysM peptidoglycan-binding domain-containing protein [Saprospiraceae bacterium]MDW8228609.1 LysM peptidoglycan-binding domain-containing protein [Saprospiraceae bacterium]
MSVKAKYQKVLDLGEQLNVKDGRVEEADGQLKVWGTVDCQYEKDQLWDAIKAIGGENPSDIVADIKVANTGYYAKHTVQKGESLSKIAQHYYGDMKKYMAIFEANRDILNDPDLIHPGQVLTIPNL